MKQTLSSDHADRPRVGLVLGSGGSRGIVHIPILESLRDLEIPVDLIVGSSIGAVMAGVYADRVPGKAKAGPALHEAGRFPETISTRPSPAPACSPERRPSPSLAVTLPAKRVIEDLPIPLGIVATDYDSGRPIVFRKGNLLEAIRASISIPGIFMPARFGGALLIDGGVADPLPIDVAEDMGADLTIAVSLHPALGRLGLIPFKGHRPAGRGTSPAPLKVPRVEKVLHNLIESGRGEGWLKAADQWLHSRRGAAERQETPAQFIRDYRPDRGHHGIYGVPFDAGFPSSDRAYRFQLPRDRHPRFREKRLSPRRRAEGR